MTLFGRHTIPLGSFCFIKDYTHASEAGVPRLREMAHFIINNDGTLDKLHLAVEAAVLVYQEDGVDAMLAAYNEVPE